MSNMDFTIDGSVNLSTDHNEDKDINPSDDKVESSHLITQ